MKENIQIKREFKMSASEVYGTYLDPDPNKHLGQLEICVIMVLCFVWFYFKSLSFRGAY